jgi:hypothetical protein
MQVAVAQGRGREEVTSSYGIGHLTASYVRARRPVVGQAHILKEICPRGK